MIVNILSWNVRGLNRVRKMRLIKSLLLSWKAGIVCLQESKLAGDIRELVKELWDSRWVKFAQLEASGTRGGIIIMWDGRVWEGEVGYIGAYTITCNFSGKIQEYSWHLSGVYAPNDRYKREEVWWELAGVRGLFEGPWVVCGDFNTVRYPSEKKNCSRTSRAMMNFSSFIEDMELVDIQLAGGDYTWRKGDRHVATTRLDRFLFSADWNDNFSNIKQQLVQRVNSDHSPIMLQSGSWEPTKAYFKFENWWLQTEGFIDRIEEWWKSFTCQGRPDFILAYKLKALKAKLKDWSKTIEGNLVRQKTSILNQLAEMEEVQKQRGLSEEEIFTKASLPMELEEIANREEIAWRQRSRAL